MVLTMTSPPSPYDPTKRPILYSYWRSSAAWRVRIVLAMKGVDYEYRGVNLLKGEQQGEEYKGKVNPSGLVPTFITLDGYKLTQSLAIIDYLEHLYHQGEPPLLPKDAISKAKVLELVYTIACDIHPLQNLRVLKSFPEPDRPLKAKQVIKDGLMVFESLLDHSGKCCFGDTVSLADVVLVPQVYNAIRWGVEMSHFPKINRIVEYLSQLPAFITAHPEAQPDAPKLSQ